VSYRDAVILLGGDPPALAALDRVLAGALSLGTGGVSDVALSVFDAQPRIVLLGRDLVHKLRDRLPGASRADRTQRLAAAHAVIVITAYFEALAAAELPFAASDLRLTRQDELRLAASPEATSPEATGPETARPEIARPEIARSEAGGLEGTGPAAARFAARDFLDAVLAAAPPQPTPDLPAERFAAVLAEWYQGLSARLLAFTRGLAVWGRLDDGQRAAAGRALGGVLAGQAVRRYRELYAQLAVEVPEFRFWAGQAEHEATRAEVRRALAGVETLLGRLVTGGGPGAAGGYGAAGGGAGATALAAAYRAVLRRPILAEGDTPSGVRLPTLEEGYLDPDFRVSAVLGGELPSDEGWWPDVPVRRDLTEYLAGALTSPEATAAPLVVLGQPGAGKSVLTKVLAARLPAAGFLPVRVVLREVAAEADIQDQVEHAIRAATGLRLEWPAVATAAPGATPVVILDGFDELLQATGVAQSDYLLKVAQFQQREADLGRPAVVIVTSRTAVADRARYPDGTVALRLEPFRDEQVRRWLDLWNASNEQHLRARGLAPLAPETLSRYRTLAGEPLLLLMLALYDADANSLQRSADGRPLDETQLYEELLRSFAAREVAKSAPAGAGLEAEVEREMQRLSLIAFSMVNRGRQWVTEAELDADLAALLGRRDAGRADFRVPLSQAGIAVGRFFFVQRGQAISADIRLPTYEFLHATFGEYLAARLTVQLAAGLLDRRPALTVGRAPADDDLLYALLSFAPLSSRQMLRFVAGSGLRVVAPAGRPQLAELLIGVLGDSRRRTGHRYEDYAPAPRATAARHAVYSANLVLLILAVTGPLTGTRLFPEARDPAGRWRGLVLLWRSALGEQDWTDLALALDLRRTWAGSPRGLEISLAGATPRPPEPVDLYWHFWYPPDHPERGRLEWHRGYWDELDHKLDLSSGTNDSMIRHAMEPVFRWLGPGLMTFRSDGDGPATSVAHDLIELSLRWAAGGGAGADGADADGAAADAELAALYRRLESVFDPPPTWDAEHRDRAIGLTLQHLRADAARLPAVDVARYLRATLTQGLRGREILALVPEVAAAALAGLDDSAELPGLRALLAAIAAFAAQAVAALDRRGPGVPATAAGTGRGRYAGPAASGGSAGDPFPAGLWPDDPRLLRAVTYRADRLSDAEYERYASGSPVGRVAPGAPVTGGVAAPAGAQTSAGTPAEAATQGTAHWPSDA
jgi:hypothetical protein